MRWAKSPKALHLQKLSLTLGIQMHTVDAPLQLLQALMHLQGTHAIALV